MRCKKVNQDPFSSGMEHMRWESHNCDKCVKNSVLKKDGSYTNADKHNIPNRCAVLRDITARMFSNEPIAERVIKICNDFTRKGKLCPYLHTEWPHKKGSRIPKNQLTLDL